MVLDQVVKARLQKRYKRFLADCRLEDGSEITAHLANPGSMKGLVEEQGIVYLQRSDNPRRKLAYSLQVIELKNKTLVCVNTHLANQLVHEALEAGLLPELQPFNAIRREVKYGSENSRVDFLLEGTETTYLEVKSVTLVNENEPGVAQFPDAKTERGARHLRELEQLTQNGDRACLFYLVNRNDCSSFRVAHEIDPGYARQYNQAVKAGVQILFYQVKIDVGLKGQLEIVIDKPLENCK